MEPLRIGIAGLGTVGTGVVKLLKSSENKISQACGREVVIKGISGRDKTKNRGVDISRLDWYDNAEELAASSNIDIFIELIGGAEGIAKNSVETALTHGRDVITANKALIAKHGNKLGRLCEENKVNLLFEAAVAGGIPAIKVLKEHIYTNTISRVFGIYNGTCNYILTRMEKERASFEVILRDAQKLGYAENDPSADIDGHDTAHKLAIMASIAFGTEFNIDLVFIEGIRNITPEDIEMAKELGYRIKLLGVASQTKHGLELRVHPTMVPLSSAIAGIDGVNNAVVMEGDFLDEIMLVGPGAGEGATASSVVADIVSLVSSRNKNPFNIAQSKLVSIDRAKMRKHTGEYYVRFNVEDRPGVLAAIAGSMAKHNISLVSIIQRPVSLYTQKNGLIPIIIITHNTQEQVVRNALEAINIKGIAKNKPQMIRIERAKEQI